MSRTCSSFGRPVDQDGAWRRDAVPSAHLPAEQPLAQEQAARRANSVVLRVTRSCTHAGRHEHGTRAAYVKDRCRCPACTAANTAASRHVSRQRAYGRWQPFIEVGPVREHLTALRRAGLGVERIALLADVSVSHVRDLARPRIDGSPAQRIRPATAARLLSIDVRDADHAPGSRIDAPGTRRRLQALVATGWSVELLAARLRRRPSSLRRTMTSPTVTARTAQDVEALYEQLSAIPPPHGTAEECALVLMTRAAAAAQGWQPPLAWDDIDADPMPAEVHSAPPFHYLDEIAIERAVAGDGVGFDDLTGAERDRVVDDLTARGRSIRDIAAQLSTTKRTISRHRKVTGRASAPASISDPDHRAAVFPTV
ncbi:protein of unknown function [Modestobacter italicus]|uniref:Uncharacterized protein n=1 Tax=Modestobacter italicus (strain DSM 44449 / CECT 9708 / BC 501) TaxID=2732864 RepID=I4F0F3_MODI5|nr:hypothetical protein [Modestobacter marinus]CCH89116.1 protein of unknown function [Modestobacter marinus]